MLPERSELGALTRRYAAVAAELELEAGEQPLVLPNGEWFPDKFQGDLESVERLLCRMQGYAGLEATEITLSLAGLGADGASCSSGKASSCGSCAAPTPGSDEIALARSASGYSIQLPASFVAHPIGLTSTLARLLGGIRFIESGAAEADAEQAELSAVALGFGVLLLEGSYIYAKSCGGPSVGKLTALGCGELSWAFSLFLKVEGHEPGPAKKELSTTQRACFDEAWALASSSSNKKLVERLRDDPAKAARSNLEVSPVRSWLASVLGLGGAKKPADREALALEALERGDDVDGIAALLATAPASGEPASAPEAAPKKRARPRDDVSDLVDEALRELRG
jgi:hypothetical protein